MYVQWSNIGIAGRNMSDVSGMPIYTIDGGNCYFCEDYDKHIGLLTTMLDKKVYDITNNYLIDNKQKLFVICGSCSQILNVNSNKRSEKYYKHLFSDVYDDGDYSMLYYGASEEEPDKPIRKFWSEMDIKQLSYLMNEVFSDIIGRKSKIITDYDNLLETLKLMNIPEAVSRLIAVKSDEYYLFSCYKKMLENSM